MKMPKNVDLSKSINREKVIEPSIANNEKNIGCPPLLFLILVIRRVRVIYNDPTERKSDWKYAYFICNF